MAEHQLNAGFARYLRSSPARDLHKSVCNDPGIPPASRRDAVVVMAAAGQDRAGLRFDILLRAGGEEQPLMISVPESAAIAEWQRCARAHKAELAVHGRDGALLRISGSPALPAPRRNGSPLRSS